MGYKCNAEVPGTAQHSNLIKFDFARKICCSCKPVQPANSGPSLHCMCEESFLACVRWQMPFSSLSADMPPDQQALLVQECTCFAVTCS